MSIKDREVSFSVEGWHKPLAGIRELGFNERGDFVINGWTTPPDEKRGTYLTIIPVSPLDYRSRHPTLAAFARGDGCLLIFDDWGSELAIEAPEEILDLLAAECMEQRLPRRLP